ncbi:unnamed protein product [Rotaria sordida]|uniref:Uncharacterized protein n=1 Tax=Rotaria sordida TaxID=392033 RepID=A0A819N0H2_9BILA|nr:unnamed protein product [Rotaria sordida]CAF3988069.1 unnamed protein product [Rotaria sordida]
MNNHRLYIIITYFIFTLIHFISTLECDKQSKEDNVPFNMKVHQSPIIVIGTSLDKNIDINIRNLFNVTFLVSCILKGRPTQRIIHIVQAGSLLGRRSCQRLNVNQQYIVFLEPFFDRTYRPVDFEEVPYSNRIHLLLEKTCGLSRTYPFTEINDTEAALTNKCPSAVSLDCPSETSKTTIALSTTTTTTTTTATNSILTTTTTTTSTSITLLGKDPIDLAVLSLLLSEHQQQNLSFDFFQGQNHKSLFSDDEARKNRANRLSSMLIINLIHLIFFLNILYIIF